MIIIGLGVSFWVRLNLYAGVDFCVAYLIQLGNAKACSCGIGGNENSHVFFYFINPSLAEVLRAIFNKYEKESFIGGSRHGRGYKFCLGSKNNGRN